jgi:uncharacterized protein (DUF1697 family)
MPRLFAFLRAINVGGHTVKMNSLRDHFLSMGLSDVETFIASGNVVFSSRSTNTAALEKKIEKRLESVLGYEVKTFVRTETELAAIVAHKSFPAGAIASARVLYVGFLAAPLGREAAKAVLGLRNDVEDFHLHGRELYWLSSAAQGETTFSNVSFEKLTKARTTFRGINTIARLAAKYEL